MPATPVVPVRYCDPEDIGRYGVNAAAVEDLATPEQITTTIQEMAAVMDGYFNQRFIRTGLFQLPLLDWGADIRGCNAVLAAWETVRVRGLKPGENPEDNTLYLAYQERMKWLQAIADGKVTPIVVDSGSDGGEANQTSKEPLVSSNAQRGWQSDSGRRGGFRGRRSC